MCLGLNVGRSGKSVLVGQADFPLKTKTTRKGTCAHKRLKENLSCVQTKAQQGLCNSHETQMPFPAGLRELSPEAQKVP